MNSKGQHSRRARISSAAVLTAAMLAACLPAAPASAATATDFWTQCSFTGTSATINPVTAPGSTAIPYFYDYYGATGVDQNSTPASLQAAGATTCTTTTDTAAYWAPALVLPPNQVQDQPPPGYPCTPDTNPAYAGYQVCHYANIRAYYQRNSAAGSQLTNIPFGMQVLGGSPDAPGIQPHIYWACGGPSPAERYPYDCMGAGGDRNWIDLPHDQNGVVMRIILPRCWTGSDPGSPASFAYPAGVISCPAGYPVLLPLITLRFHTGIYDPCRAADGTALSCPAGSVTTPAFGFENADGSQQPWYQANGAFMNGWQYGDGGLGDLVSDCLITGIVTCPPNPHAGNMPT